MQTDIEMPRRRGRPRQFDPDVVLGQVEKVFLEKGFAAASLDDLGAAAGLNRPSLYAAFGDKEQLFIHALERYGARQLSEIGLALDRSEPIEERMVSIFRQAVTAWCAPEHPAGCLIAVAAAGAASGHPAIAASARRIGLERENAFRTAFARCLEQRLLPAEPTPEARAQLASAILDALAVRARLGEPRQQLETFAQESLALICAV